MIRLHAISLGYAVPRCDFVATVHSVFNEAVNLQSRRGSRLLTIVKADCTDLPQGIRLNAPDNFSFVKGLQPGDRLICRNNVLDDEHEYLSINLRQATRWKCELPEVDVDEIPPPVMAAWKLVWQALNERQRRISAEIRANELLRVDIPERTIASEKMRELVDALLASARYLDLSAKTCVAELIGLGPGLTPSGDDFLVGYLTGLRSTTGKKPERLAFLSELGKAIIHFSRQTNDISRTYLFHATRGQISSVLAALLGAIARGVASDHLLLVAENAMQVGHSSGMEMVTGLLLGLSTWGKGWPAI